MFYLNRIAKLSTARLFLAAVAALAATTLHAEPVPAGTDDEVRARLAPFGNLCRAGDDCGSTASAVAGAPGAAGAAKNGEEIYNQFCFVCHATGVSDAPLFADSEAWAPRVAKGMESMLASSLNGLGMMPAMGTCMSCSDEEMQAAIDFMLEAAE